MPDAVEVLRVFTRLGLTSFGGPSAHIGYFREEIVRRRGWVDEERFRRLVALAALLPGPTSSQVGFALGWLRAGFPGALAAFVGFTWPSAALLVAAAVLPLQDAAVAALVHSLRLLAVAVVTGAVVGMARALPRRPSRWAAAGLGLVISLLAPAALGTALSVLAGALFGALGARGEGDAAEDARPVGLVSMRLAVGLAALVPVGVLLPVVVPPEGPSARLAATFFRTGALVFGGGHVILPLLREGVVDAGLLDAPTFFAGYGLAQAIPGPLSSFAGYVGMAAEGLPTAAACLVCIFLPGFLLVPLGLALLDRAATVRRMIGPLEGAAAAVVGVLGAAAVDLMRDAFAGGWVDVGVAVGLFVGLVATRRPPWQWVGVALAVGAVRLRLG